MRENLFLEKKEKNTEERRGARYKHEKTNLCAVSLVLAQVLSAGANHLFVGALGRELFFEVPHAVFEVVGLPVVVRERRLAGDAHLGDLGREKVPLVEEEQDRRGLEAAGPRAQSRQTKHHINENAPNTQVPCLLSSLCYVGVSQRAMGA
jgi:hypothetical protein